MRLPLKDNGPVLPNEAHGQTRQARSHSVLPGCEFVSVCIAERRRGFGRGAGGMVIHLSNDSEAVGKTLAFLSRVGVSVKRVTVTPGAGESAVLRVELGRALQLEQVTPIVQRLLALKYVSRVDTTELHSSEEMEAPESEAVPMVE